MCVWLNQRKYNLIHIIKLVIERRKSMERRNILAEMSGNSLALYRDMNFSCDKQLCIECCARRGIKRDSTVVSGSVGTERNQKSKS